MKIILMRHGQAEGYRDADSSRQLTAFGYQQAQETAEYVLATYQPDCFVVSPYDRAQQTLAALTAIAPKVPVHIYNGITPSDEALSALKGLAEFEAECLVVVCHMSIIAYMAALLTGETPESFQLAEARVFEAAFVATAMGKECDRFIPAQP